MVRAVRQVKTREVAGSRGMLPVVKGTLFMDRRKFVGGALAVPAAATVGTSMRAVAQEGSASPVVEPDPSIEGTIAVGMVGNPQMVALQELVGAGVFNVLYPNITVELTVLPENEIRQTIARDVATQSEQFDIFTVGPFEVPLWAANGWLEEVGEEARACLLYTSPSPRDRTRSRMPSSA